MNPRRILPLSLLALCLTALPATAQQKIGLIDLKKAFDNYWKTKQADLNLKERAASMDKERKIMVDEIQKATEDYKKLLDAANDQAIAAAEREKKKKTAEEELLRVRQMEQNIQGFDRQARQTLGESQRRMRDNILKEIRDIINARAKVKGFTLVLDTAAESVNQTPVLIYHTGENDLTDDVLKELNASAPAIAPAAPAAPPAADEKKK